MSDAAPASHAPGGASARVNLATGFVQERWGRLSPEQRVKSVAALLGLLALVGILLWWAWRPNWRVLYSGLAPDEARQIGALLTSSNLTYDVTPDGTTLRVPAEQLDKARLSTAGKAAGKAGRIGFELFDKPDWAGSDFDEKVNYQRALEGELEHTIDTLSDVESSRVHLVLPHDSLFSDAQRDAKASVVLRLKSHALNDDEAGSIKSLVASAVDDLSPDRVVLMDADGRGLLGGNSGSNARAVYEQLLAERILQTLEPVVGMGNVRATVNVDYDQSSRDEVDENYDPGSVVTLSMQRAEQISGAAAPAQGVPGTASNAPNQQVPLFPPKKPDAQSSKQESGTYGASKKTRHLSEGPGSVRRISAAILVNDRVLPGPDKNVGRKKGSQPATIQQPWTEAELKQLVALSQASVGYEEARGDKVVVQNRRFDAPTQPSPGVVERLLGQAGRAEPLLKDGVIGAVAIAVLLLIVRPALKTIVRQAGEPRLLATGERIERETSPVRSGLEGRGGPAGRGGPGGKAQDTFDQVVDHIQRDPVESARVLQTWIRAE